MREYALKGSRHRCRKRERERKKNYKIGTCGMSDFLLYYGWTETVSRNI